MQLLYSDGVIEIGKNDSGEIFVDNRVSGTTMRMNPHRLSDRPIGSGGIEFTVHGCGSFQMVEPTIVNGSMIGWRVGPHLT